MTYRYLHASTHFHTHPNYIEKKNVQTPERDKEMKEEEGELVRCKRDRDKDREKRPQCIHTNTRQTEQNGTN